MKEQLIKTLVNGSETSTIDVTDRGLQFGDGVFESIKIHQGKPVWWQQHIKRLLEGCRRLEFASLPDIATLKKEVDELLEKNSEGSLKIIISRGNSSSGYAIASDSTVNRILTFTEGQRHQSRAEQGIVLGVCEQTVSGSKQLAGIKHLNRLEQVMARNECQKNGWDEGLMLDGKQRVIEGTMSNLFLWKKNMLLTPLLEHTGIRGICRDRILSLAKDNGIQVEECEIQLDDLQNCDGLFLSNSLIGIWPVVQFKYQNNNDRQFAINARTRTLQKKLEAELCSAD